MVEDDKVNARTLRIYHTAESLEVAAQKMNFEKVIEMVQACKTDKWRPW